MDRRRILTLLLVLGGAIPFAATSAQEEPAKPKERARLVGRAVLPAATFAPGPTSGAHLGPGPIHGQPVPFRDAQPVQGFSAIIRDDPGAGTFLALSDNGFGTLTSSPDYHLRIYRVRPELNTHAGGSGRVTVLSHVELRDPDGHLPFAIVQHFTKERILTGADLDPESLRRAVDGTLWVGDEHGPFLLHFDAEGRLLEPPLALPDPERRGAELRSPESPLREEGSAVRVLHAIRAHARARGGIGAVVCSPSHLLLKDGDPQTFAPMRIRASELFDVRALRTAGFRVVPWTVNDAGRMRALLDLGVGGLISDRPDILLEVVRGYDADGDGQPGDLLDANGLIDRSKLDAQGHRGARDLRPENTLPAMEAALDHLMPTLELDCVLTKDGIPVLSHDPELDPAKLRPARGEARPAAPLAFADLDLATLQSEWVADGLPRGGTQTRDLSLSPVSVRFAAATRRPHPYAPPSLDEVVRFATFYAEHYERGPGKDHPDAARRAKNARRVAFNVETKVTPEDDDEHVQTLARAVGSAIVAHGLEARATVQSFDVRALLAIHESFRRIDTACLFGREVSSEWLAGLPWPRTDPRHEPPRVPTSGGFEGMAISPDGLRLYPMLEKPLVGSAGRDLLIFEVDLRTKRYTAARWRFPLDPRATAIGDFALFAPDRGLVIERDDSQGDLSGYKRLVEVRLAPGSDSVERIERCDLLDLDDEGGLSLPGAEGDVGIGRRFAFPFWTIEGLAILGPNRVLIVNDNNFPFSVGRHVGSDRPDDTEWIEIELGE